MALLGVAIRRDERISAEDFCQFRSVGQGIAVHVETIVFAALFVVDGLVTLEVEAAAVHVGAVRLHVGCLEQGVLYAEVVGRQVGVFVRLGLCFRRHFQADCVNVAGRDVRLDVHFDDTRLRVALDVLGFEESAGGAVHLEAVERQVVVVSEVLGELGGRYADLQLCRLVLGGVCPDAVAVPYLELVEHGLAVRAVGIGHVNYALDHVFQQTEVGERGVEGVELLVDGFLVVVVGLEAFERDVFAQFALQVADVRQGLCQAGFVVFYPSVVGVGLRHEGFERLSLVVFEGLDAADDAVDGFSRCAAAGHLFDACREFVHLLVDAAELCVERLELGDVFQVSLLQLADVALQGLELGQLRLDFSDGFAVVLGHFLDVVELGQAFGKRLVDAGNRLLELADFRSVSLVFEGSVQVFLCLGQVFLQRADFFLQGGQLLVQRAVEAVHLFNKVIDAVGERDHFRSVGFAVGQCGQFSNELLQFADSAVVSLAGDCGLHLSLQSLDGAVDSRRHVCRRDVWQLLHLVDLFLQRTNVVVIVGATREDGGCNCGQGAEDSHSNKPFSHNEFRFSDFGCLLSLSSLVYAAFRSSGGAAYFVENLSVVPSRAYRLSFGSSFHLLRRGGTGIVTYSCLMRCRQTPLSK